MPTIHCKYCGSPVLPENVDVAQLIARCKQCGAIFGVATQLASTPPVASPTPPPPSPGASPSAARPRPPVAMPQNITVAHEGNELRLTRHWRNWQGAIFLGFGLFWCSNLLPFGFVLPAIGMSGGSDVGERFLALLVFCGVLAPFGIFPLIGLLLAYWGAAQLLNRTIITASPKLLDLYSGPLWVPGDRRFRRADVQQLYCVEHQQRGGRKSGYRAYFTYEVRVQFRNGQTRDLLIGLPDVYQALYIEQEIERFLGIRDVPVPGEIFRN